jgi:hypothetical protein
VYGDVVRLEHSIHGSSRARGGGQPSDAALAFPGVATSSTITHNVSGALVGWSFTGIALTGLIVALAVSADARKLVNIFTQLLSIQVWFLGRKVVQAYKRWTTPTPTPPPSPLPRAEKKAEKRTQPAAGAGGRSPVQDMTGEWQLKDNTNYQAPAAPLSRWPATLCRGDAVKQY